jgi:predicted MFS family arabinose efflux permease
VDTVSQDGLSRRLVAIIFICMLVAASTMHFYTPMLDVIGREFDVGARTLGWIPTATTFGFIGGVVLIAPLGDVLDKRRLILGQMGALVVALGLMCVTSWFWVLVVGSFVVGMGASASQQLVGLTAQLTPAATRGRVMGTVLSGMLLGILTGRVLGGLVAGALGWRGGFGFGALLVLLVLPLVMANLPSARGTSRLGYGALLGSLVGIMRRNPVVSRASRVQGLLGIGYGGFWAMLAPMLAVDHGLGSAAAGLFGIPGAAGVLVAAPVGRWVDRGGSAHAVLAGAVLVLAAYGSFALGGWSVWALVVGVMLLDFGIRASLVANQTFLLGIEPEARARVNMLLMVHTFGGNGIGALLASNAFASHGWTGVVLVGSLAALLAAVLHWHWRAGMMGTSDQA